MTDIDFEHLGSLGRRAVLIDVDNTISRHSARDFLPGVVDRLEEARRKGWIQSMCLLSNIVLPHRLARIQRMASVLQCHAIGAIMWESKPSPLPFYRALAAMGASTGEAAMIGDQIFTDVLGANRLGIFSILVRPVGPDAWTTPLTLKRWRESRLLEAWNSKGSLD